MRVIFLASAMAICLLPNAALAQRWVTVGRADDQQIQVDRTSVRQNGPYKKALIRAKFSNANSNGIVGTGDIFLINCRNKTRLSEELVTFFRTERRSI